MDPRDHRGSYRALLGLLALVAVVVLATRACVAMVDSDGSGDGIVELVLSFFGGRR